MIRNKTLVLLIVAIFMVAFEAMGQNIIKQTINWTQNTENSNTSNFNKAQYLDDSGLPRFVDQFPVKNDGKINFTVNSFKSEPLDLPESKDIKLTNQPYINGKVLKERNKYFASYSFYPFVQRNGRVERITEIELAYDIINSANITLRNGPEFTLNSVLSTGEIGKVSVNKTGICKITYSDLEKLFSNVSDIDPNKIQVFGNPGGMNPEANADRLYDDLVENAIFVEGGSDGSIDQGDYILFYGHGPHSYSNFEYRHNVYDDLNYYFIKIGEDNGLRVEGRSSLQVGQYVDHYDAYRRYELDEYNLLADFSSTQGSGRNWFSTKYRVQEEQVFTSFFKDESIVEGEEMTIEIQAAGRSGSSSRLDLTIGEQTFNIPFNAVSTSRIESTYADLEKREFNVTAGNSFPEIKLRYASGAGDAEAWLDYLFVEYKDALSYENQQITFRHRADADLNSFGYQIEDYEDNLLVWDVTDIKNVRSIEVENGRFGYESDGVSEFVLFDPNSDPFEVEVVGKIENQNLHSVERADLVIVYHPDFEEAAMRLAEHRARHDDLDVTLAPIGEIYNEFSSGRVDVAAIRDFARMIYLRDPNFLYLTLIGDGTYDYKYRDQNNSDDNYIPVYQTDKSLHPINAFPTDDFYALLDEQEGDDLVGGIDIAVGRIPARTLEDANTVVDKIIFYDTDEKALDDWRLRIGFAADDEDNNFHFRDSDEIAEKTRKKFKDFNVEKIYFDAFPQVATPGGERYPQATEALYNNLFKGMLTLCYLGHGGPKGWAQERVLKREDVPGWKNAEKLPLMVTATCSFTGFDNPADVSAGETILFQKDGGAIGLMSTVRAVFVNRNKVLTESVFDTIFTRPNGQLMGIGEVLRRAKNSNASDTTNVNARKFLLIGDPTLKLAIPQYNIQLDKLNGENIDADYTIDTIGALEQMTFEGFITDQEGKILTDFNGIVTASVFDKLIQAETLRNNESSRKAPFNIQKTILFKGQSEVVNGRFKFDFYLPADINFDFGNGKISLYAKNETEDASGYFENFIIGGSNEGVSDDNPPTVEVFLNDEDFVFGGISNPDPILLVKLSDDFGINVSGVSVGHDLVATLDDNSKEAYILNDFYEADLNNSRSGTVRFPLKDIEPGKHTIKIKAWDLSNNPGEGYTEFIVVEEGASGLQNVLNYPNPFSTRTLFQFEHNLPGMELEILINIYNMSGQIVKTIEHITIDDGFRIDDIEWDGLDDYGQKIANGVYLYKINVKANQFSKESNYEKLVILK